MLDKKIITVIFLVTRRYVFLESQLKEIDENGHKLKVCFGYKDEMLNEVAIAWCGGEFLSDTVIYSFLVQDLKHVKEKKNNTRSSTFALDIRKKC